MRTRGWTGARAVDSRVCGKVDNLCGQECPQVNRRGGPFTACAWKNYSLHRLVHMRMQLLHTQDVTCNAVGEGRVAWGTAKHHLGYFRHHRAIARTTAGMSLRSARQSAMTAGTARASARAAAVTTTRIRDTGTPPLRGLGSVVDAMVAYAADSFRYSV